MKTLLLTSSLFVASSAMAHEGAHSHPHGVAFTIGVLLAFVLVGAARYIKIKNFKIK